MTNIAKCDAAERKYHVVALEVPIVFNRDGDHDHNGLIFALGHNKQARQPLAVAQDAAPARTPAGPAGKGGRNS
jgi:hypothetical protein